MATGTLSQGVDLRSALKQLTYWDYLTVFFAAVTVVAALGEWVFHWWQDPGQYVTVGGFVATLFSAGFGSSRRDVRQLGDRLERRFDRSDADHHALLAGQQQLLEGQQRLVDGQQQLLEGQERLIEGQQRLIEGQERMTTLLEQVVHSFRRGP
jgi:uncharacterized membrane protein YccC